MSREELKPARVILSRVFSPIPQIFLSGSESMNFFSAPFSTIYKPSGFDKPEAIFAMYLFDAAPMEIVKPVRSATCALSFFAASSGVPNRRSVPLISINASSIDICRISGENSDKTDITSCDFSW